MGNLSVLHLSLFPFLPIYALYALMHVPLFT